jgi:hypothetical protein
LSRRAPSQARWRSCHEAGLSLRLAYQFCILYPIPFTQSRWLLAAPLSRCCSLSLVASFPPPPLRNHHLIPRYPYLVSIGLLSSGLSCSLATLHSISHFYTCSRDAIPHRFHSVLPYPTTLQSHNLSDSAVSRYIHHLIYVLPPYVVFPLLTAAVIEELSLVFYSHSGIPN